MKLCYQPRSLFTSLFTVMLYKRNHITPHALLNIYGLCVEAVSLGSSPHLGMALSQSLQVAGCPLTRSASPVTNRVTQLCSTCLSSSSQRQCVLMAIAGEWKVVETYRPLRSRVELRNYYFQLISLAGRNQKASQTQGLRDFTFGDRICKVTE